MLMSYGGLSGTYFLDTGMDVENPLPVITGCEVCVEIPGDFLPPGPPTPFEYAFFFFFARRNTYVHGLKILSYEYHKRA